MPVPDPKYLRPSIDPRTAESHQVFRQACASGDLARVTSLAIAETPNAEYLTQGLLAAIYQQRIQIVEYLLNTGAVINRAIPNAAASAKSLAIFRLLVEHGWDVNDTVMGGETILPCVVHTSLQNSTFVLIRIDSKVESNALITNLDSPLGVFWVTRHSSNGFSIMVPVRTWARKCSTLKQILPLLPILESV